MPKFRKPFTLYVYDVTFCVCSSKDHYKKYWLKGSFLNSILYSFKTPSKLATFELEFKNNFWDVSK